MTEDAPEFGCGGFPRSRDGRLDAPSFYRNRAPVTAALIRILDGRSGDVLEVGSGTGQHAVAFANAMPALVWWPSDVSAKLLRSIEGWRAEAGLANLRAPIRLDAAAPDWPLGGPDAPPAAGLTAIVALNVLHIAPWPVALGLLGGAARHLAAGGVLVIYGAFMIDGRFTAASNARFDAALRRADSEWGVRDTADLHAAAAERGLVLAEVIDMPSSNFILLFERSRPAP